MRLTTEARDHFTHVDPVDTGRARVVIVPRLTPGVAAITLGHWILVRRGFETHAGLLAHELVHVEQWRVLGPARFLVRYLRDYLHGRARGLGHWAAYSAIALEVEARRRSGT